MTNLGLVIVTYNSESVVGACLQSCPGYRIVVVDNASQDRTLSQVIQDALVLLIANPVNRGFAGAVNQGVAALDAEWILLLNPDVELLTPVSPLVDECVRNGSRLAGGKLVDAAGLPQSGFNFREFPSASSLAFEVLGLNRLFPRNPVNVSYRRLRANPENAARGGQPAGALLLFQRSIWQQLGGFDESFFPVWFEDVDFCKRALDLGFPAIYVPSVVGRHQGGHSVSLVPWLERKIFWYGSLLRYATKHLRPARLRAVAAAVLLASVFRGLLSLLQRRSLEPIAVYSKVFSLAASCLFFGRVPGSHPASGISRAVS